MKMEAFPKDSLRTERSKDYLLKSVNKGRRKILNTIWVRRFDLIMTTMVVGFRV